MFNKNTGNETGFNNAVADDSSLRYPEAETIIGADRFSELVKNSTVFVDKSLLIKEFLNGAGKVVLITYPRRWGKTINMDMIKTFLELEVDAQGNILPENEKKNTDIFANGKWVGSKKSPLNIWYEQKIVDEYFGKYPVISISFKGVRGNSYVDIKLKVTELISRLYRQHRYLLNSTGLAADDKAKIQQYIEGQINIALLEDSINNLAEYLGKHFVKQVFILIDEYDTPINYVNLKFAEQAEIDDVLELFRGILGGALKGNNYLNKGLVTGIFRIAKADLFSGVNNFKEYNILDAKYSGYYGFTREEVEFLLKQYGVTTEAANAIKSWYNGYSVDGLDVYNPWSLINCLEDLKDNDGDISKALKSYWEESGNVNFVKGLLKTEIIQENIEDLVDRKAIYFDLKRQLSIDDFIELRKLTMLGSNYQITGAGVNLLFSYLFFAGYLTMSEPPAAFRAPNNEIRNELGNKLLEYYQAQYTIDTRLFQDVTDKMQIILNSRLQTENLYQLIQDFKLSLTTLLKSFPKFGDLKIETQGETSVNVLFQGNEDLIHSVMNYIVLQVKTLTRFATEISIGNGRADIALIDVKNNCVAIIELKYNQSALVALNQIKEKKYARDISDTFKTILLGVNVFSDKTVEVEHLVV